jgi:hypothetical protein
MKPELLENEMDGMKKFNEVSAFREVPKELLLFGIILSILGQMTGVPILSHKQCTFFN